MLGYDVDQLLARFEHPAPTKPQHSPHRAPPRHFGGSTQKSLKHDHSPKLPPDQVLHIQQIIGTIMYYAWAVNLITLVTLSSIASVQEHAIDKTEMYINKLLDYLHTHKDATIWYAASGIRHGTKHPLWCILTLQTKSQKPSWWHILPWQPPTKW